MIFKNEIIFKISFDKKNPVPDNVRTAHAPDHFHPGRIRKMRKSTAVKLDQFPDIFPFQQLVGTGAFHLSSDGNDPICPIERDHIPRPKVRVLILLAETLEPEKIENTGLPI